MNETVLNANLPESSILFYRSRFEVFPDKNIHAEIWPQIIRVLQNWLENKEDRRRRQSKPNLYEHLTGDIVNYSSFFDVTYQECNLSSSFAEGTLTHECTISRLETKSIKDTPSEKVPRFWTFDYIERDSVRPFRRWRTNVGVTSSTSGTYIVNVRVAIYDDATYMGQAEIPYRNTPNFIVDLLDIKDCVTLAGEMELSDKPIPITKDTFRDLLENLESQTRVIPIVVISAFWNGEKNVFDIDSDAFAKKLAGSALVYTLNQDDYDLRCLYRKTFSNRNESAYRFGIPNGGIRVFLPQVNLNDVSDSYRHRFYTRDTLKEHDLEKVSDDICIGVSRLYQQRSDEVVDLFDIQLHENKIRREYYATQYREAIQQRDLLAHSLDRSTEKSSENDLREENGLLWEEIKRLEENERLATEYIEFLEASNRDDLGALREKVQENQQEIDHLSSYNTLLNYDIASLREEYEKLQGEAAALKIQTEAWESSSSFPSNPLEAVEFAENLFGDRIVIHEEAKKSADEFSGDENEVFQILKSIHHHLWPLLFNDEQIGTVDVANEFQIRSGFELALNESGTTQNNQKFMRLRKRWYQGHEIDIAPHAKGTSGRRDAPLRVHYWKDSENGKIVIGHCGDHLDTAGTRHKK